MMIFEVISRMLMANSNQRGVQQPAVQVPPGSALVTKALQVSMFFKIRFTIPIRQARWLVKVDDDTVLSTNRLKMLVDKLQMEEEEGVEVEEEIFCKHKKDTVLRPEDPKPYWVSH